MSMVSTQLAPTMETVISSWTGSTSTTMRHQVHTGHAFVAYATCIDGSSHTNFLS